MSTAHESVPEVLTPEALDQRFRKPLLGYFFRRTADWTDAEDLTQQTFLRLYQISDGAPAGRAQTFVFAIAAFLLKEHRRSERVRGGTRVGRVANVDVTDLVLESSETESPERRVLGRDNLREALRLLAELGPRTHDIYVLFRIEGLKHREIAVMLGISVSAVEKHIIKAASHLAAQLGPTEP